jgi:hypothetical protein
MKRAPAVILAVGALALADTGAAKGPFAIEICGSSGCTSVHQETVGREPDALGTTLLAASDRKFLKSPTVGTPAPAPYLSLTLEDWVGSATFYYVPSRRLLRMAPYWFEPSAGFVRRMDRVAAAVHPFPPPTPTRVRVNGRRGPDPASYAALLGPLPAAPIPTEAGKPMTLTLSSERASPWTDVPITYFPAVQTLYRDSQWLRMPERLGRAVEREAGYASPQPPAGSSGSGLLPWIVAGGVLALLLGATAGLTVRVRRARPAADRSVRPL